MWKSALVSAFWVLLLASRPSCAEDIEQLLSRCSAPDLKACAELAAAASRLTDQGLLARVTLEAHNPDVRIAAVKNLTDQAALAKIAENWDGDPFICAYAAAAMAASNPALKRLGEYACADSIAQVKVAIEEPRIRKRFPHIVLAVHVDPRYQQYQGLGSVLGDLVSFALSQDGETLAVKSWETYFPPKIAEDAYKSGSPAPLPAWLATYGSVRWRPVEVHSEQLLAALLDSPAFTQEDLHELSASEVSELRSAAADRLTDRAALAKVALGDKSWAIRVAALAKLTDQAVLAKIALGDSDQNVRHAAVERLTDQAVLARIALASPNDDGYQPLTRTAAAGRLTDQALLAKVVLQAKDPDVRAVAVGRLTDQALLAKVVLQAKDPDVRAVAVGRLTDQALLAKFALGDRDGSVRYAAVGRLTDRTVLEKIAIGDKDPDIRHYAVSKLTK